jgi:hypothetical protein
MKLHAHAFTASTFKQALNHAHVFTQSLKNNASRAVLVLGYKRVG